MSDDFFDFGRPLLTAEAVERIRRRFQKPATSPGEAGQRQAAELSGDSETEVATSAPPQSRAPLKLWRPRFSGASLVATVVLVAGVWLSTGFYKVQPDQKGIVLRFGRWIDTRGPGLNFHLPFPVETVLLTRVTQVNQVKLGNGSVSQMLTGDENIVEATASVTWRISDPGKYLFNVSDPDETVRVAGESAIREIIGLNPIQSGLSDQRQKIADDAQQLLQKLLDSYDVGIKVTQVQLERVDPPLAVIDAFNDVQRARADQERARNEAEAYSNDILPRARGEAIRISEEAHAYKELVVNHAQGEASRFAAMRESYGRSKDVTARRLYLDTMEEVLKSAGKILIDPSGKAGPAIVPFLPLVNNAVPVAPRSQP